MICTSGTTQQQAHSSDVGRRIGENIVKIQYSDSETGLARVLKNNLALIMGPVVDSDLWAGDLVELTQSPADCRNELPKIAAVLSKRYCANTIVEFFEDEDAGQLTAILRLLGADCRKLSRAIECLPGQLLVGHHHSIDPRLLAEAIGIDQDWDDLEPSEEDDPLADIDPYER